MGVGNRCGSYQCSSVFISVHLVFASAIALCHVVIRVGSVVCAPMDGTAKRWRGLRLGAVSGRRRLPHLSIVTMCVQGLTQCTVMLIESFAHTIEYAGRGILAF